MLIKGKESEHDEMTEENSLSECVHSAVKYYYILTVQVKGSSCSGSQWEPAKLGMWGREWGSSVEWEEKVWWDTTR